ncbi:MAG TPA: outer membrane beta-barrel protein [Blastocatellia bacterium]|nr:outer membrane beta-barrel protein [Blastocatellia bacterium]
MRKISLLIAVFLLTAIPTLAQEAPTVEVFGGYSYFSSDIRLDNPFDDDEDDFFDQREGLHGVGFSIAGNFHPNVGIVADLSYNKREIDIPFAPDLDSSKFTFLFGPRFTYRGGAVDVFGHTLVGGVRSKFEDFDSVTDFALGLGGGVDIKAGDNFAIRVAQIDYIPQRTEDIFTDDSEWIHNVRFQIGAVFRWGNR